jgi:hypothetical protein
MPDDSSPSSPAPLNNSGFIDESAHVGKFNINAQMTHTENSQDTRTIIKLINSLLKRMNTFEDEIRGLKLQLAAYQKRHGHIPKPPAVDSESYSSPIRDSAPVPPGHPPAQAHFQALTPVSPSALSSPAEMTL